MDFIPGLLSLSLAVNTNTDTLCNRNNISLVYFLKRHNQIMVRVPIGHENSYLKQLERDEQVIAVARIRRKNLS